MRVFQAGDGLTSTRRTFGANDACSARVPRARRPERFRGALMTTRRNPCSPPRPKPAGADSANALPVNTDPDGIERTDIKQTNSVQINSMQTNSMAAA